MVVNVVLLSIIVHVYVGECELHKTLSCAKKCNWHGWVKSNSSEFHRKCKWSVLTLNKNNIPLLPYFTENKMDMSAAL